MGRSAAVSPVNGHRTGHPPDVLRGTTISRSGKVFGQKYRNRPINKLQAGIGNLSQFVHIDSPFSSAVDVAQYHSSNELAIVAYLHVSPPDFL